MRARVAGHNSAFARIRDFTDFFAWSSPARFALIIFTGLVIILTAVLSLPIATTDRSVTPLADAFFTAMSAICVTGLATVDMASHWSTFGNVAILIGLEVGGIGVLTLASILGLIVSRRLGLKAKLLAASDSNPLRIHAGPVAEGQAIRLGEIGGLLATVAISVLSIEAVLTFLFVPRLLLGGEDAWTSVWQSFYFATSAFTNTGFVPRVEGMAPYAADPWMLSVIGLGVVIGSLGFPVIFALTRGWRGRHRMSIHVKLTLTTSAILIVAGAIAIYALEWNNSKTLGAQDPVVRPMTATFLSLMTRSGGFSTVDVGQMHDSSLLVMDMLMFVGGGSASTAGGIKVTTLAVLFLAALAEAKGDNDIQVFGRRIPPDVLRISVSVVLWGATIVAVSTIALLTVSHQPLNRVLFDVISAFGTCGLSTGATAEMPDAGKYILAATMWAGRVGTVTLAAAVAASQRRQLFTLSEERPIVG
ncbi:Trk-type K+ transport system membrane component [Cryobacterium mesophilum]|uniref:TrkH family potassium uptake protein n=1 Tax=Terrimesophilobacter mesophilus TaxID=433647 RepID=A0A4R8VBS8_9MICO|nr:potassium transporter TrkG [Terrimesophilobacter mesophilus]MBB5633376.1 Trk-type K+ transport system membrane component [Terrimesophilobacter mesophilus]TFB80105.1 TrkH family potassium uptake protein [Terrimesophilobacter mesophilus]